MKRFIQVFGSHLQMTYGCFDRIVINAYLPSLVRECNLVYLLRTINGIEKITQEVLRGRTEDYQKWIEGYALRHEIPLQWSEKGVRKQDSLQHIRKGRTGPYYILKSMEQGWTYRIAGGGKGKTGHIDRHRGRFTHYYFYLIDEVLGPMALRVGSFLPFGATCYINGHSYIERALVKKGIGFSKSENAFLRVDDPPMLQRVADSLTPEVIAKRLSYWCFVLGPKFSRREQNSCWGLTRRFSIAQIEYCRNFVFNRNFPIRSLFERSCELGLYRLTAGRVANFFERRITGAYSGKLRHILDSNGQGQFVLRTYFKNSFLKQYEKERTFLRTEAVCNDLKDLQLKKSLQHLPQIQSKMQSITDNFTDFQAEALNTRPEFDLLARLAKPVSLGKTKVAGIKLENSRLTRLFEALLHRGIGLNGWSTKDLHAEILNHFQVKASQYKINQLRYDMRKLRAHGLLLREKGRYAYQLTQVGKKAALLFTVLFKRIFGSLSGSLFLFRPSTAPQSDLERAFTKVENSIDSLLALLEAA